MGIPCKLSHYWNNEKTVATVLLWGKPILQVRFSYEYAKSSFLYVRYRRVQEYMGPLPSVRRTAIRADELEMAVEQSLEEIRRQLEILLRFCFYTSDGVTITFNKNASLWARTKYFDKTKTLRIHFDDSKSPTRILPIGLPRTVTVGYDITKSGLPDRYAYKLLFGLLQGFTNEYVTYVSHK